MLLLADEIDINELNAFQCLLDSQGDPPVLGRPLLECGVIRFHQQRKYVLDSLRLLLELAGADDGGESASLDGIKIFVATRLLQPGGNGSKNHITRCMSAMAKMRKWLQQLGDKIAAAQTLDPGASMPLSEQIDTVEFSRLSIIQQHELLGVILCRFIEKRQAGVSDFLDFISILRNADKYDILLIHLMPAIGAYISQFGSTEGGCDLIKVRELNNKLFPPSGDANWRLPQLQAAFRAWWLAEYSGFYLDDPPEAAIPPNADLDEGGSRLYVSEAACR